MTATIEVAGKKTGALKSEKRTGRSKSQAKSGPNKRPDKAPDKAYLAALFHKAGIPLTPLQTDLFWAYHQMLRTHNPALNLTRIHNFSNMVQKLYVDSALPAQLADLPSPLMDLGSGPGMPGIPLKIMRPDLEMLLAESRTQRSEFLGQVVDTLNLSGIRVLGRGIAPDYDQPVGGVITRAVETISDTLERVSGCLIQHGRIFFMKGPRCDDEIQAASNAFKGRYELSADIPYTIPGTPHQRRLVIYRRLDKPLSRLKSEAGKRHGIRAIESDRNAVFKDLKKLLSSRGIKKQSRTLVCGQRLTREILERFPQQCRAWIGPPDVPPPPEAPARLQWYQTAQPLFKQLDIFGTIAPLVLFEPHPIIPWEPRDGLPKGCSVMIPFQDPENVGAVIRSAAAFGVDQVILLAESAHPFHPKAVRASGGAVFSIQLRQGPSINDLPPHLPIRPLSADGSPVESADFPATFALLPGLEGPGIPDLWRKQALAIPIRPEVESLNAAAATAIVLYLWARAKGGSNVGQV